MNLHTTKRQSGSMLLEALIAILIFSFGVLGLVGLQYSSTKLSSDAKYRSDAALLADELVGKMSVSDHSLVQTNFASSPAGTEYTAWLGDVATPGTVLGTLPGAASNPPTVQIDTTGGATNGMITINLYWAAPYDTTVHTYSLRTQLNL